MYFCKLTQTYKCTHPNIANLAISSPKTTPRSSQKQTRSEGLKMPSALFHRFSICVTKRLIFIRDFFCHFSHTLINIGPLSHQKKSYLCTFL